MRGPDGAPIGWPGDSRAALHRDRRRPDDPRPTRATSTLPDGVPDDGDGGATAAEGARRLRHQRRAAAGQEGRACNPRELAEPGRRPARGRRRHRRRSRSPGPGFLNITRRRRRPGRRSPRDVVAAGAAYGTHRRRSPGEKINLEFVSANPTGPLPHRRRPLGRGRRRARPGPRGDRRRGHPRVLLQRPRRPDRPVRPVAAGQRAGRAGARGRLRRRSTSHDIAAAVVAERPDVARPARRRGAGGLPGRGRRADVRRDQAEPRTTSASTSTSTSTRTTCTRAAPSSGRSTGCTELGNIYEQDGALWLRTDEVRRRQGPGASSGPTASRPTSPATWPTTSTSASAASTAASSCSAPTTTATSAG